MSTKSTLLTDGNVFKVVVSEGSLILTKNQSIRGEPLIYEIGIIIEEDVAGLRDFLNTEYPA
jgi:hypothetical protein